MPDEVQTVTITGGRPVTETYDQEKKVKVPAKKPFYSVECDGLPNGIENFAIWPEFATKPGDFIIGKTYEIAGYVKGRYFNFTDVIVSEVKGAKPGVNGVPQDRDLAILKGALGHDAATITAALINKLDFQPGPPSYAGAAAIYVGVFKHLLTYRLGDNHQTEAKEGSTVNSGAPDGHPARFQDEVLPPSPNRKETTPPGEEYPPE
ncbi:MAG: hypothetical protein J3T61_09700 [Candidatus Brocadiales bacterium]|nr:hypothetical protein [Candidatus Bathyanammoxibius sp.]